THMQWQFRRRYRGTSKRQVGAETSLETGGSTAEKTTALNSPDCSPLEAAIAHEEAEAVQRALERLPEDYRLVIQLRIAEELSFDDIGRRLGRSVNAVEKLWVRAYRQLQ